jgi:AraC-like DNA-binding protein
VYLPNAICRLVIKKKGGTQVFAGRPGDAFILPAGTSHQFESPACITSGINIQYTLFSSVDILDLYNVPIRVSSELAADIGKCIERMVDTIGQIPEPGTILVDDNIDFVTIARERQLAFQLLAQILQLSDIRPRGKERLIVLQKLKESLRYIEENLENKISIETLSELAGLSAHRFGTLFKEVMGDSPHQYILRRRIDKAMMLLSRSDAAIMQIAEQLGFHDQPHFTKLFKAIVGVSPTYYRKNFHRRFIRRSTIE